MATYVVDISEDVGVEIECTSNAPTLERVTLEWVVSPAELPLRLAELGGSERFSAVGGAYQRVGVPVRRDGEDVGSAILRVCVREDPHGARRTRHALSGAGL